MVGLDQSTMIIEANPNDVILQKQELDIQEKKKKSQQRWTKSLDLIHDINNYQKVLKIWQYVAVIICEYKLVTLLKLLGSKAVKSMSEEQFQDWSMRFKKMGSNISTIRMALRLFNFLDVIQYFYRYKRKQDQGVPIFKIIRSVFDFISSITDNWIFLARIDVYKWTNSHENNLINQIGTFASIVVIVMDVLNELLVIYQKSKNDPKNNDMKQMLYNKRLWFLQKLFDFPIQIQYTELTNISRGQAHALSIISPIVFIFRHYGF
eukprot:403340381